MSFSVDQHRYNTSLGYLFATHPVMKAWMDSSPTIERLIKNHVHCLICLCTKNAVFFCVLKGNGGWGRDECRYENPLEKRQRRSFARKCIFISRKLPFSRFLLWGFLRDKFFIAKKDIVEQNVNISWWVVTNCAFRRFYIMFACWHTQQTRKIQKDCFDVVCDKMFFSKLYRWKKLCAVWAESIFAEKANCWLSSS